MGRTGLWDASLVFNPENPGIPPQLLQQFLEFRIQHLTPGLPPDSLQHAGRDLSPPLNKRLHPRKDCLHEIDHR